MEDIEKGELRMAKILVYNNDANTMETYYRGEDESMPYITNGTLRVGEFRGSSTSPTLWAYYIKCYLHAQKKNRHSCL